MTDLLLKLETLEEALLRHRLEALLLCPAQDLLHLDLLRLFRPAQLPTDYAAIAREYLDQMERLVHQRHN